MGGVVHGAQGVGHGVSDAQAHIGEGHAGDELAQGHAFAALVLVVHGAPQALGDEPDGLQVQAVGQSPGGLGGVALNGVGQGIHAGGGGEALGHGGHHVGVHDGDVGDVVGVHADELALALHVGDDVVDGGLGGGAGGGGHGDGEHGAVLGGGHALQGADVGELGVVDDDADGLAGVHGGAAADGDHVVGTRLLVGLHAGLDVLNGGVGLDVGVDLIGHTGLVQQVGDLLGDVELDQVGVGGDEGLLVALGGHQTGDLLDGALSVIRDSVEHKTIDHDNTPPVSFPFYL